MATRKQRARRAKTFRHEYGFVEYDEEGNEIEVAGSELRGKKDDDAKPSAKPGAKPAAKPGAKGTAAKRSASPPPRPTWERALKRGGIWGLATGLILTFLLHAPILLGVVYAVVFIPLTFFTDGLVYRRWERKHAAGPPKPPARPGGKPR